MFFIAFAALMYICGFVFLYGVVRLAVRHGIGDVHARRELAERAPERPRLQERLVPDNPSLAGN
ncbi:hypothetical protein [Plantactinospora sp. CA-290183]|uniref:hypothetical protein n=1 Tax=Plantactinospora sp. CA-290183 TaxID=3240006 RepID=UPI003D8CB470